MTPWPTRMAERELYNSLMSSGMSCNCLMANMFGFLAARARSDMPLTGLFERLVLLLLRPGVETESAEGSLGKDARDCCWARLAA